MVDTDEWFRGSLQELSSRECFELLAQKVVGRVAYVNDDGPVVLPVNYVVDKGSILFRTSAASSLAAHVRDGTIAFQVDEADEVTESGWSVLLRGRATFEHPKATGPVESPAPEPMGTGFAEPRGPHKSTCGDRPQTPGRLTNRRSRTLKEGAGMTLQKQMDELTADECLRLLDDHTFGRLAFMDHVGVLPMIVPVNYVLHDDRITFRTGAGSKLGTALRGEPVAFEVDGLDPADRTGWSVLVRGHAEVVTDTLELAALWETPLQPWAPGAKPYYVRIEPRRISGRRIRLPQLPTLADYWWG